MLESLTVDTPNWKRGKSNVYNNLVQSEVSYWELIKL